MDKDGIKAHQGVAELVSFKFPDKRTFVKKEKGEVTQGKGYYGESETNSAVKELIKLDDHKRTETGTDVFILGFVEHTDWIKEITKSVIEGYLISILQNDLIVTVEKTVLNADNIGEIIESLKDEIPLAYNYYQVLNDAETIKVEEEFYDLGKLELYILIKKDFRRKVLMARSNGMKIFDKDRISGAIQFAGVCILKDKKLNAFFRKMENPQHDDWQPDRYSEEQSEVNKAKRYKKDLFKFIKDKVIEIGRLTVTDEMDAIGAGEYVSDINACDKADDNKSESISNAVKEYSSMEKVVKVNVNSGVQKTLEENFTAYEESEIGKIDNGDTTLKDFTNGENTRETHGNNDGTNYKDGGEGHNANGQNTTFVKPVKVRVFIFDITQNLYKLTFTPDISAKNAYVKIKIAGEQSDTVVKVDKSSMSNGTPLVSKGDTIYIGDISKDNSYSILYSINFSEICSTGVEIHGYKI